MASPVEYRYTGATGWVGDVPRMLLSIERLSPRMEAEMGSRKPLCSARAMAGGIKPVTLVGCHDPILGAIPLFEARLPHTGSIVAGYQPLEAFLLALAGNLLPIIPSSAAGLSQTS